MAEVNEHSNDYMQLSCRQLREVKLSVARIRCVRLAVIDSSAHLSGIMMLTATLSYPVSRDDEI